jgi:demethylmenaquinone methyltransferase / 2-methoxy-6-polyprenyl-1,4-benzoquinol methylase
LPIRQFQDLDERKLCAYNLDSGGGLPVAGGNRIEDARNDAGREPEDFSFGYQRVSATEKDRLVRDHFTSIARKYDFMNTLLSFGLHYWWKRATVKQMPVGHQANILDVCGGTADLALLALKGPVKDAHIWVYDINYAMLKAGKGKVHKSGFADRVDRIQGDAEIMAFRDNTFDGVMVGFGIRNFTHMEKGLAEMYRVLRPGGTFVCLEFSRPKNRLFGALYDFYSFVVMPLAGSVFAGSRKAYTYLPESIRLFPSADRLASILTNLGFSNVTYRRLTNGIAVIHRAEKPRNGQTGK